MIFRMILFLISIGAAVPSAHAQTDVYTPDPELVLRLIRNDKLELILPKVMRDNNVDMWIHVGRDGDPNPLKYMVHTNLPERPGFPLSINISNVQAVTNLGVEWIQPPNERIILVH